MGKMFIANCSSQHQVLAITIPDLAGTKAIQQPIAMGKQDYVGGQRLDLSPPQVDAIVAQLRPYGLISAADVNRLPHRIVPYIWSETAIKGDVIRRVMDHNKGVHVETGAKRRERAALGTNDALKKIIEDAVNEGQPVPPVDTFVMEVEEVDSESAERAHDAVGSKPVAVGLEIDNRSNAGPGPSKRTTRNRSRANA